MVSDNGSTLVPVDDDRQPTTSTNFPAFTVASLGMDSPHARGIPFLEVEIKPDIFLKTAVDSCATISLARTDAIPLDLRIAAVPCHVPIGGFNENGPSSVSKSKLLLTFRILDQELSVTVFLVDHLFTDLLLGLDAMELHQISVITTPAIAVTCKGEKIPLLSDSISNGFECAAAQNYTIPPRTTRLIRAKVKGPHLPMERPFLVTIRPPFSADDLDCVVSSQQWNEFVVPISNNSFHDMVLSKHTIVGHAMTDSFEVSQSLCASVSLLNEVTPLNNPVVNLSPTLSPDEKDRIGALLEKFKSHIVSKLDPSLGPSTAPKHSIDTGTSSPIHCRPRHVNPLMVKAIDEEIDKMLNAGIISPHQGSWSSPVHMVRKKDGAWRFCIDYRALNDVTKDEIWPLPRIESLLGGLHGASWYSTLDLASGFWQIKMDEISSSKAAFVTPNGSYKPNVMPFGLKNAPAAFQRAIHHVLRKHIGKICVVYIDDILIFSRSFEEHLLHVSMVLEALREANLQIKADKCTWFVREVDYLGHHLSASGVTPTGEKTQAIANARPPKNLKELRSFLGLANYYRRFILDFAKIAKPLNFLLQLDVSWHWAEEQQLAFEKLKSALVNAAPLPFAVFDGTPFILDTDASNEGMGAVLSQSINGVERPLAYWSSGYATAAQLNYSATDREFLAILRAMTHFSHTISGAQVIIRTDHQPLVSILKASEFHEGMRGRWLSKLQQWKWTIQYRPGRVNGNADGCSRNPIIPEFHVPIPPPDQVRLQEMCDFDFGLNPSEANQFICAALGVSPPTDTGPPQEVRLVLGDEGHSLKGWQQEDEEIAWLLKLMKEEDVVSIPRYLKKAKSKLEVINEVLYHNKRYVVPLKLRELITQEFHHSPLAGGHFGRYGTLNKIKTRYWWPRMKEDIHKVVKTCESCQAVKARHTPPEGLLHPLPITSRLFQRVAIDITGPFPISANGNAYLLVLVDY